MIFFIMSFALDQLKFFTYVHKFHNFELFATCLFINKICWIFKSIKACIISSKSYQPQIGKLID